MEETTTTVEEQIPSGGSVINGVLVDDQGNAVPVSDTPQPEPEPTPTADVTDQEPEATPVVDEPTDTVDTPVDKSNSWLEAKGISPDDPQAIEKAAQMARESEKAMHEARKEAAELRKSVSLSGTNTTDTGAELDPMYLKVQIQEFRLDNPDVTKGSDLDVEMGKIVSENVGYWINNLDTAKKLAKANLSETDIEAIKEQARAEERKRLQQSTTLSSPAAQSTSPSATSNDPATVKLTPDNVDFWAGKMTPETYRKRMDEINAVL